MNYIRPGFLACRMRMDICEILLENSAIDLEIFLFRYRFESDLSKHFLFLLVPQIRIRNDYSRSGNTAEI